MRLGSGQNLLLGQQLARGAQGSVHDVVEPPGLVFKHYTEEILASNPPAGQRIQAMIAHQPQQWREPGGHVLLAWPTDVVLDNQRFVGFVMPKIDLSRAAEIHDVSNPSSRTNPASNIAWTSGFTWRYLAQTAANLALATQTLHDAGYVIGDFNDKNILVHADARVTLLDCDSMQFRDPTTGTLFLCDFKRADFDAPERLHAPKTRPREPNADLFPLAIHIFQLLFEGRYPFDGIWAGPGEKPTRTTLAAQGLFNCAGDARLRPQPTAPPFDLVPSDLRQLFTSAFVDGATRPSARPTAHTWHTALTALVGGLHDCPKDPHHTYGGHLTTCPWCQRSMATSVTQTALPPATQRPRHCWALREV